jgi:peptide/nickel transport system substrate-binding protein
MPVTLARAITAASLALCAALTCPAAMAEPRHAIAMYGDPALAPDFVSRPEANPAAPKGGSITFGEAGGFDSLNPFILKGNAPGSVSTLTIETLMGRSYDEPFSLYGLLAESIDTDDARSYVAFTLRPQARFSDGNPVTVADVLWSMQTLGEAGNPRYAAAWKKVASATQTGPRTVRFTFTEADREMPLLLGLRPILEKASFAGRDFAASSLAPVTGSGPYVVDQVEPGNFISYRRNPDWWGRDLPFNAGLWNFDRLKYVYFADPSVMIEALKAGDIDLYRESSAAKWATDYNFPAVQSGEVVKEDIPHQRPSGIDGLVFNTRKPIFADWRVREALIDAFNFELVNQTLNGGANPRIQSYFDNSDLSGHVDQPASPAVAALLAPYKDALLPGALDGYALPVSDGSEANRANLRKAMKLLQAAGWTVQDGTLKNAAGQDFTFDILLASGEADTISAVNIYIEALKKLGITATVQTVDAAQYKERTNTYNFDMTHFTRSLSLSPGNEQTLYWGSAGVSQEGSRNWMGVASPAVDGLITTMVRSKSREDFVVAVQALDRVLTTGRYVIPFWYSNVSHMAHKKELRHPDHVALYGDWLGFMPDVWWVQN